MEWFIRSHVPQTLLVVGGKKIMKSFGNNLLKIYGHCFYLHRINDGVSKMSELFLDIFVYQRYVTLLTKLAPLILYDVVSLYGLSL